MRATNPMSQTKKYILFALATLGLFLIMPAFYSSVTNTPAPSETARQGAECETFPEELVLQESDSPETSADVCWWLNSGGSFFVRGGLASTMSGPAERSSRWHRLYAASDPVDTEGGLYPQNLFRLISKKHWLNARTSVEAFIESYNASMSPSRNESNGVFLMTRYYDEDNFYLAGIRVDGTAVIKRKLNGLYETIGQVAYTNPDAYDRLRRPNLLPTGQWLSFAMEVTNESADSVIIRLDVSFDGEDWHTLLTAVDQPSVLDGGEKLLSPSSIGVRTDFMDVRFRSYKVTVL